MSILKIDNLTVSYKNTDKDDKATSRKRIIENFNLDIASGELIVILGPSGCGKSTLLSAISGLIKPDCGSIKYNDETLFNKDKRISVPAEKRNIGFVFQSYALWPHMTVYQNIELPLKAHRFSKAEAKSAIENILDIVHMKGYEGRYPDELSGGEKQRIALARSLVYRPSLLLLDEPLANLDANLKISLISEIKDIQKELGITTIYVTHDQQEAFEIADRIVIMNEGKIMQQGTPMGIYKHSDNLFVAEFVGKNNIFKAGDRCPRFLKQCQHHKAATIRPEDIEICNSGQHTAVVKHLTHRGDHIEYIVDTEGYKLVVKASNEDEYKVGDNISFCIKRHHVIL